MSTFEIAFRDRIAVLRRSSPDDVRRELEAPDALLLPLTGAAGITVSSEDIDTEAGGVSPRLGDPSRSDN